MKKYIVYFYLTIILIGGLYIGNTFLSSDEEAEVIKEPLSITNNGNTLSGAIEDILILNYTLLEAIKIGDIEKCNFLVTEDQDKIQICRDTIYYDMAIKNMNYDFCKNIVSKINKIKCLQNIKSGIYQDAIDKKDQKICQTITSAQKKENCVDVIDKYYFEKRECGSIYNHTKKDECISILYNEDYNTALDEKDVSFCNLLENIDKQNQCIQNINSLIYDEATTINQCGNITLIDMKNNCIAKLGLQYGTYNLSISSCNSIKNKELQTLCLDNYYLSLITSYESNDISTCLHIKTQEIENYCLSEYEKNKVSLEQTVEIEKLKEEGDTIGVLSLQCEQNNIGSSIAICKREQLTNLAIFKNDLEVCSNVTSETQKNICINNTKFQLDNNIFKNATKDKNPVLCEGLYDKTKVDFCKEKAE